MKRLVVNCHHDPYDVYVGRKSSGMHYGNPFSHLWGTQAAIVVGSRDEAIDAYRAWLAGEAYVDLEPERRKWILEHLPELKLKVLGCHCYPKTCHASVLVELAANAPCSNPDPRN